MIPITLAASRNALVYEWHYEAPRRRVVLGGMALNGHRRIACCGIAIMTARSPDRALPMVLCAYGADGPVESPGDVVHILNLRGNYFDDDNEGYRKRYGSLIPGQVCMDNSALGVVDRDGAVNAFWNSSLYWDTPSALIEYRTLRETSLLVGDVMMQDPRLTDPHWHVSARYTG